VPQTNGLARAEEKQMPLNRRLEEPERMQPQNHQQVWRPVVSGFKSENDGDDLELDKLSTIPIMVLKGIARQQGSPEPVMKSDISNAAGNAAFVSVGNIGGAVLKYGSNLVIQRGFGVAAFGLYTLGMSIMGLAIAIFNLGLDDAMVRYVSAYRAKLQTSSLRGLTIFCSLLAGASGILGALIVLYLVPFLVTIKHSPELTPLLLMLSPIIPLMCLQTIWSSGLQGFKEFRWRVMFQRLVMPVIMIFMLLGCLVLFHSFNAVIIVTLINALLGTLYSLFFFFRKVSEIMKPEPGKYEIREWLGFAIPNFLTSIMDTVLESIDTILLVYFAISNVALGQYAAAIKLSSFIVMPQNALNTMFAPTIAELYSQGEKEKLAAMFKVVTKWAITFSLPIFGITTLFSSYLLSISGPDFVPAWPLVIAFAVGAMINVSTGSVGYMLLMTGHTKISSLNSITAVVVNVVVGSILAPRYGAMGVAAATGLAVGVVNLMKLLQVFFLVKMQPYRWDVLKPLGAGFISAGLTAGLLYLFSLAHLAIDIDQKHVSFELSLVPVFLVLYIGLLLLFKVSPEDEIVLDALRRKFRRNKKTSVQW
jgi:O-antigen/teichoic acid export membrane protein